MFGFMPTGDDAAAVLASRPNVVRLAGGSHWFLLPDGVNRYINPSGHDELSADAPPPDVG